MRKGISGLMASLHGSDVVFRLKSVQKPELYKSVPSLVIANKPAQVVKIDDSTVKFTLPHPRNVLEQCTPLGQYHAVPQTLLQPVSPQVQPNGRASKAANQSDWAGLFRSKCGDIEIPARWGNVKTHAGSLRSLKRTRVG